MSNHQPRQVSLRELARELGVTHSSLSAAAHDGRLVRGVRVDRQGRVVVTDADAAAANWRGIRVTRPLEHERAAAARQVAEPAVRQAITLWDEAMGCWVSALKLFAERDALAVLVLALAAEHRDDRKVISKRISKRLREVAESHGADETVLARAELELRQAFELLEQADEDEP